MKEITLYQTIDGNIFTDKVAAFNHEKSITVLSEELKEPPHRSGIYRWTCKPEGKTYTGKAVDLNNRFWDFIDSLKGGNRYAGEKVQKAIEKYPTLDAWQYSVLKYVDNALELNESEKEKIKEVQPDKTLNIQHTKGNRHIKNRFCGSSSKIELTEEEYKQIDEENKSLGKKHGYTFRLNWSLMNLSLGKHEISKDTIRHIPTELGNAINFSVTDSTCYRQVSDIGDRPHGYYAKIVNKGILTSIGPYERVEDCKKKYLEEKVKIIKQLLPKYRAVLKADVFSVLSNLTIEEAGKLNSLR